MRNKKPLSDWQIRLRDQLERRGDLIEFAKKLAERQIALIEQEYGRKLHPGEDEDIRKKTRDNVYNWVTRQTTTPHGTKLKSWVGNTLHKTSSASVVKDIVAILGVDIFKGDMPTLDIKRRPDTRSAARKKVSSGETIVHDNPTNMESGPMDGDDDPAGDGYLVDVKLATGGLKEFFDDNMKRRGKHRFQAWRLTTDLLDRGPCKPGSYLVVELGKGPKPQEPVLAITKDKVYIFRLWIGGRLITGSRTPTETPTLVEGKDAKVLGVVTACFSP